APRYASTHKSMFGRCAACLVRCPVDDHAAARGASVSCLRLYRYAQGHRDSRHAGAADAGRRSILWDGLCLPRRSRRIDYRLTWLRTFFSQLEQPVGHRYGSNGSPCETRDHGGKIVSSVKAVFELSEVAGHMLLIDRSIGSGDSGFDVAERRVDPFEPR